MFHVSDGFPQQKKFGLGWVGEVSLSNFILDFWNCFNFANPLNEIQFNTVDGNTRLPVTSFTGKLND